jgi:hypothetical protein
MSRANAMKTPDMHTTFGFQKITFTREIAVHDMLPMTHLDEQRDALLEQLERRMSAAIIAPRRRRQELSAACPTRTLARSALSRALRQSHRPWQTRPVP